MGLGCSAAALADLALDFKNATMLGSEKEQKEMSCVGEEHVMVHTQKYKSISKSGDGIEKFFTYNLIQLLENCNDHSLDHCFLLLSLTHAQTCVF